jgi:mannose-1-phosphate guanylyltransferase
MAGGSGTRFWPESRKVLPKQFLKFAGAETLIQAAYMRCQPWITPSNTWVITNQRYAAETNLQLNGLPQEQLLLEPVGRNTAPCIAWAAAEIFKQDPDGTMIVMSADHIIAPAEKFQECAKNAASILQDKPDVLVLFGIKPNYASTGFGYIQRGQKHVTVSGAFDVLSFKEKPDQATAESYLATGEYYWNSGIFVWKAKTILNMIEEFQPEIFRLLNQILEQKLAIEEAFPQMPSISIDYAVLEHAKHVTVLEATFDWDDVGSWQALSRMIAPDSKGNTRLGKTCVIDTRDSIIRSQGDHLIATYGVSDLIIVHTPQSTLVAKRGDENGIKELIKQIGIELGEEFL